MSDPQHPSIRNVEARLNYLGIETEIRHIPEGARTAAEAAFALGVEVGQIANSLVFTADGEPLLVMTSGAHRVNTAALAERTGRESIGRADAETVRRATGQVIGGVAPIGHPAPLPTLVDRALEQYDELWAAAGHSHAVFRLTFDELVRITGGIVVDVD